MVNELLQKVSSINQKYELVDQKTGGHFNIFDIMDLSDDEVKVCRFLYELLNPKGSHYQGGNYLKRFVEEVLCLDDEFTDRDYSSAKVSSEYGIAGRRRIDL